MKKFLLLALVSVSIASFSVAAPPRLFVFGDSLSDTGNVFASSGGAYPGAPYYNGRFSNGPVWVEKFASNFGYTVNPSLLGGTNFAFGGAEIDPLNALSHNGTPNIGTQIGMFAGGGGTFTSSDLVAVWAGGNDFLNGATNPTAVANNLQTHLNSLYALGARQFLVLSLPLLGLSPTYVGGPGEALANGASVLFNTQLASNLAAFKGQAGNHVYTVDVPAVQLSILANPGAYGLTDTTHAFLGSGASDPSQYFFWDSVHPTANMHKQIGAAAIAAVPEPTTMAMLGLAALVAAKRRRSK